MGGTINEIKMQPKQKTQHLMEVVEVERRTAAVTVKKRSDGADESIPSGGPDRAASRCLVPLQSSCGYESNQPNGPARASVKSAMPTDGYDQLRPCCWWKVF